MAELVKSSGAGRFRLSEPQASVLIVDDNPANLVALRALLDSISLEEARSGEEAVMRVHSDEFAAILLDVRLPGISGFETAKLIRNDERSRHTPIIFVTANDITNSQLKEGYTLGAVDFLIKPIIPFVIQAKVRQFIELFQDKQRAKREADQLRLLVHGTKEYAIFMLDPDGNIITWNAGAERLKGYKASEILGQHFSRFYPREATDRGWPEHELRVAQVEGRFEDEGWRVRKDGSQFWANVVITALRDDAGNLRGFSKVTRDMTERKRAEENARRLLEETTARRVAEANARLIQEQRERLHVILSSIGDAVISTDAERRINFLNPVAQKLIGRTTEEIFHRPLEEVFHIVNEHTREPVENPAVRALKEGVVVGLANHTVLLTCDGREVPIDDSAAPMRDAEGNVIGCVLVFRDISERKRVQEERERFALLVENSHDFIGMCGMDLVPYFVNREGLRLVGLESVEQIRDTPITEFFFPEDRNFLTNEFFPQVLREGHGNVEIRFRNFATGEPIWFAYSVVVMRDAAGRPTGMATISRDISSLKEANESLRAADRRKDEFLATLAHELRNPLAPIRNSLQILKMSRVDAMTTQQIRALMERQVHHLVRLVDDLLDVSRVMRGKIELRKERVELASVIARAVETAKSLIEVQQHQFDISVPPESLLLDADPVRLVQVVGNVLVNAAKYTEANGRIWLSARQEGDEAVLCVRDTGIGVAPDMLPHIFDLFVQADHSSTKAQGGLGIGLTLVKNLVEMHGGSVEAHSSGLGKGSEFVIRLPLLTGQPETVPTDISESWREMKNTGHRLLVVDDNHDAANTLALLLRLQGHEVNVAHDGATALEMASTTHPSIIFLDIGMPGMDGYEVARRIRKMPGLENTMLAALTGWGQQEDRRRTAEAGFDHHLVKPPEPKELEQLCASLPKLQDAAPQREEEVSGNR